MTALAEIDRAVLETQTTCRRVIDLIGQAETKDDLQDINERIKLAREWAKINKIASEVRLDLLRTEAACLLRIHALGHTGILSKNIAAAASEAAAMSPEELDAILVRHTHRNTVWSCLRAERADLARERGMADGASFARGAGSALELDGEDRRATNHYHLTATRVLLARVIDDFAAREDGFTVSELTEDFIESIAGTEHDQLAAMDPGVRQGLAAVCRDAVRKSPSLCFEGTPIPRFVTCIKGEDYVRIPFENATPEQLDQMIELRTEQLEQDKAALQRLKGIRDDLAPFVSHGQPMGDPTTWRHTAPENHKEAA